MAEPNKAFWQKHPGVDGYSLFLLVLFLLLGGLGRLYLPLLIPAAVVLVYLLIRLLSKNVEKRQLENARFFALFRAVGRWFRQKKGLRPRSDKTYYYFKCPTCGQAMRLPKGLGRVEITCRSCASKFEIRSPR